MNKARYERGINERLLFLSSWDEQLTGNKDELAVDGLEIGGCGSVSHFKGLDALLQEV